MGKRYYCDFCNRYFADSLPARKKHLSSIQHIKLRKLHYDSFKDASELLAEESKKPPCKRFFQTGQCSFGSNCRYSHVDPTALLSAQQQHENKEDEEAESSLGEWLKTWEEKREKNAENTAEEKEKCAISSLYMLPAELPPVYQLPPSLHPPPLGGYGNLENTNTWG